MNINPMNQVWNLSSQGDLKQILKQTNKIIDRYNRLSSKEEKGSIDIYHGISANTLAELSDIGRIAKRLLFDLKLSSDNPQNKLISQKNRDLIKIVIKSLSTMVIQDELLEKMKKLEIMKKIDEKIGQFESEVKELIEKPADSDENRHECKKKIAEIKLLKNEAMAAILEFDQEIQGSRDPNDSTIMQLCMGRLKNIQEINDELLIYLIKAKEEKHKKAADLILKSSDDPQIQARELHKEFKAGNHVAVRGFLKIGKEAEAVLVGVEDVENIEVNLATSNFQTAARSLCDDFEHTAVDVEYEPELDGNGKKVLKDIKVTTPQGQQLEFNADSFSEVDFSQIKLSNDQIKKYEELTPNMHYKPQTAFYNRTFPSEATFLNNENKYQMQADGGKLQYGEKLAINVYTGDGYKVINRLMAGDINGATQAVPGLNDSEMFKQTLLHSVVCLHGINKLDDYTAPDGKVYLWRGEGAGFKIVKALEEYKTAVDQGGAYIRSSGFLSTAYDRPSDEFFNGGSSAGVLIKGCYGKKIIAWSQYEDSEREVLIGPTHLKLEAYKEVNMGGGPTVLFTARLAKLNPKEEIQLDKSKKAAATMKEHYPSKKEENQAIMEKTAEEMGKAAAKNWFKS
jgi:hypothetical protein